MSDPPQPAAAVPFRVSNSLRSRLLVLVLLATLPSTVVSLYNGWTDRSHAIHTAEDNLKRLAELAAAAQARSLETARTLLADLARSPEILQAAPVCSDFFASVLRRNSDYGNVGFILPNGDVGCSAIPSGKIINVADRPHFQRAITERRFVTGNYVFGRLIQRHTVNLTYPVQDAQGGLIGVLFTSLDLTALDRFIRNVDLPPNALLITTDVAGTILSSRPARPEWIGEGVDATVFRGDTDRQSGTATVTGMDGVKRLHAFSPVGSADISNFVVTIGFPMRDIVFQAEHNLAVQLFTALVTTLIALLAAWIIGDRIIVGRIGALVRTAQNIAAGRLEARTHVRYGNDEVSTLAKAVDNMAESLQAHELERDAGRRMLFAEKELAEVTLRSIADAVMATDREGRLVTMNQAAERLTGWKTDDIRGMPANLAFRLITNARNGSDPVDRAIREDAVVKLSEDSMLAGAGGVHYAVEGSVAPIRDDKGRLMGSVLVFRDVSEAKALSDRISYQASHDGLTGLCNRMEFERQLASLLDDHVTSDQQHAVLYLDLDRFKQVNDTLGHDNGDLLLQEIAARLKAHVRSGDVTARLGGDEFVILLKDTHADNVALTVADKLLGAVCAPIRLAGHEISVSTSIGGSLYPRDGMDVPTLLKHADLAMYQAKELNPGSFRFFDPQMNIRMLERLITEHTLRGAIDRNELVLHYQPRVSIPEQRIVGAEALVRWNHPEKGLIGPAEFIPLAEEMGLINALGEWVLRNACQQAGVWQRAGLTPFRLAVNMSAQQLGLTDLPRVVASILQEAGLAPGFLEIEITESSLMQNMEHTSESLRLLRSMGVSVAIDDFGTGYSSLAQMKRLPVDALKIDQSFVFGILTNEADAAIVRAMISLAHQMRLKVVAEGVTEVAQLDFLHDFECDEMQGYLFSRPLPAEAFEALLSIVPGSIEKAVGTATNC